MRRFMRFKEVAQATGLSRTTIYNLIKEGRFPKQVKIVGPKIAAWCSDEIEAWQQQRISARDSKSRKAA